MIGVCLLLDKIVLACWQVLFYFLRCDLRLALCCRYFAFCRAEPLPCAPVIYFFFLALVLTLSSSFSLELPFLLKTNPPMMMLSMSFIRNIPLVSGGIGERG